MPQSLTESVSADCNGYVLSVGDEVEVTDWGFVGGELPIGTVTRVATADDMGVFLTLWHEADAGAMVQVLEAEHWLRSTTIRKVTHD